MDINKVLEGNKNFANVNFELCKDHIQEACNYYFVGINGEPKTFNDGNCVLPIRVGDLEFFAYMKEGCKIDEDTVESDVLYEILKDSDTASKHYIPLPMYIYIVGAIKGCFFGSDAGYEDARRFYDDDWNY